MKTQASLAAAAVLLISVPAIADPEARGATASPEQAPGQLSRTPANAAGSDADESSQAKQSPGRITRSQGGVLRSNQPRLNLGGSLATRGVAAYTRVSPGLKAPPAKRLRMKSRF